MKYILKQTLIVIVTTSIFYGGTAFITLDLEWPLHVSNAVRGLVVVLWLVVTYLSVEDGDNKSLNQKR